MVSLAFVISFVVSAVAMVIGVVMFSEITEAMAVTLPEILVTIPTTPEVDGVWFGVEHCPNVGCFILGDNTAGHKEAVFFTALHAPPSFVYFPNGAGMYSGTDSSQTDGYIGRTFDKTEIDGKLLTFEVSAHNNSQNGLNIQVLDGEFDITTTNGCGVDCFPIDQPITTSGSGGVVTLIALPSGQQSPAFYQATPDLTTFDSPTGKVTIVIKHIDHTGLSARNYIYSVEIEDTGTYYFKTDGSVPSWIGSTITTITGGLVMGNVYTVTSSPPPAIPVINSQDTLNANEKFDNAKSIGFTVLGVLPVALFFGLFTILSPRVDE